jgi:hypothetical protein
MHFHQRYPTLVAFVFASAGMFVAFVISSPSRLASRDARGGYACNAAPGNIALMQVCYAINPFHNELCTGLRPKLPNQEFGPANMYIPAPADTNNVCKDENLNCNGGMSTWYIKPCT